MFKILAKLAIAALLIGFLVYQGQLDFSKLLVLAEDISFSASLLGLWFASLFILALRWWLLLRGLKINVPYSKAFWLTWIGSAFNLVLPGSVSGDLLKGYQLKEHQAGAASQFVAASLLMDRLLGLLASVCLAVIGVVISWFYAEQRLLVLEGLVFTIFFVLLVVLALIIFAVPLRLPLKGFLQKIFLSQQIQWLKQALKAYQGKARVLFIGLWLSLVLQSMYLLLIVLIAKQLLQTIPSLLQLMIIFPLGLIMTVIPIAPGGAGVGHISFESLFQLIGSSEGANIFNLYLLTMLAVFILGFIPFWVLSKPKSLTSTT